MDCLRAAIANGADAVYLGGRAFNARMRVANFGPEELAEARELTGRCNVRLYVTMNTLLAPADLEPAARQLDEYARLGADALIVQDAGLLELAAAAAPAMPLFASTQMTLSEPAAITQAHRRWNIRRVILPRETSLAELAQIRGQTEVELEVFIHGAICISYSGQCHASRVAGGRSSNKGQCAQPCRLPWRLAAEGKPVEAAPPHVMSPRDLCLVDRLGELWRAGAHGFKIEGRAKSPEYVATVVDVYRRALDRVLEGKDAPASPEDRYALAMSFCRGFTHGYVDGNQPGTLTGGPGPGNAGVRIGHVEQLRGQRVIVALEPPAAEFGGRAAGQLKAGDGVAFGLPDEEGRRPGAAVYEVGSLPHGCVALGLDNQAAAFLPAMKPGLEVWKTSDPALDAKARHSYRRVEPRRKRRIDVGVAALPGKPLLLRCGSAEVASERPLEAARQHPLTLALLREQLGRLGNTAFELGELTLLGPEGPCDCAPVMAPKSVLNELRRQLVEKLEGREAGGWLARRSFSEAGRLEAAETAGKETKVRRPEEMLAQLRQRAIAAPASATTPTLSVLIRHVEQLVPAIDALAAGPLRGRIYLELATRHLPPAIERIRAAGMTAALVAPRVFSPSQRSQVERLLDTPGVGAMLVRNGGTLALLLQRRGDLLAVGDAALNITNELAARAMLDLGLALLTPGRDLAAAELPALLAATGAGLWELPVYLHEELFFTQHCLWSAHLGNGRGFDQCGRPCRATPLAMQNPRGQLWPVWRDTLGRTVIFESQARRLKLAGRPAAIRIELLDEAGEEIASAINSSINPFVD